MIQPRDIVVTPSKYAVRFGTREVDTTANLAAIVVAAPLTVLPDTTVTVVFLGGHVMRIMAKFLEPLLVTQHVRSELLLEFLAARAVLQ